MKALLDTNIIIHRESSSSAVRQDIGDLFGWLDRLHVEKCIHPVTVAEIAKLPPGANKSAFEVKLRAYTTLAAKSSLHEAVALLSAEVDSNSNDINDTAILNELYLGRVDAVISEDRKLHEKASRLAIGDRVFTIEGYLEKAAAENPSLADYKVLAVRKELFGNIDVADEFFDSFREDYPGFDAWFNRKSEEIAYVCRTGDRITAFLYLKVENESESYPDIAPPFGRAKRLKIGTLKVALNGYRLGERFLKIIFDNALRYGVTEIYVTVFDKRPEQKRLIALFEEFGFVKHGVKTGAGGDEQVHRRALSGAASPVSPKMTYPFFSKNASVYLVPIYPEYHTSLLPDSILRTESPLDFVENEPFRNAISKVYICRSRVRDMRSGDVLVFYRTGGYYHSVVSTIGIVESVVTNVNSAADFIAKCRKRSVFSDTELLAQWEYNKYNRPFITNFLYAYSFAHRINLKQLIDLGVIRDVRSAPRGFERITTDQFALILRETKTDGRLVVD